MGTRKSWKEHVVSGFRIARLMNGGLVFALLLWGAGAACSTLPGPKGAAWIALMAPGGVVVQTVELWSRALPGLLVLAAFNALVFAASSHLTSNVCVAGWRIHRFFDVCDIWRTW